MRYLEVHFDLDHLRANDLCESLEQINKTRTKSAHIKERLAPDERDFQNAPERAW
jgi:hypothetical protein